MLAIPNKQAFTHWLFHDHTKEHAHGKKHTQSWKKTMCLTGVDYFSTLGYQPGIAALEAGVLAPIATLVLVAVTLFGALPMYNRVVAASPHGDGSISMLERLMPRWWSKLFVLVLIGFCMTSFIITVTLSAADAAEHIVKNPYAPESAEHYVVWITIALIAALGGVFLKGFKEAVGIAVILVTAYMTLNLVIVAAGVYHIYQNPQLLLDWQSKLFVSYDLQGVILVSLMLFPRLALGLSGFETGALVAPLVTGYPTDTEEHPVGRIHNTQKLLLGAAVIMSFMLIMGNFVTTVIIPAHEFMEGGEANGRALAYVAHMLLGSIFGTGYDVSTILILWFAGASAVAGLLYIIPRYLPRYGMAPEWAKATRPLTIVIIVICIVVTFAFDANVDAQGAAYATGVLALIFSAAVAVAIRAWQQNSAKWLYMSIAAIFAYTTFVNISEAQEGLEIAGYFIAFIVGTSLVSRIWRSTELRSGQIHLDAGSAQLINEISRGRKVSWIAHRPNGSTTESFRKKEMEIRSRHLLPADATLVFFEVVKSDPSEFKQDMYIRRLDVGEYIIVRTEYPSVSHGIAGFMFYLRDVTGKIPHMNMGWTHLHLVRQIFDFLVFGEGETVFFVREITRQHEPKDELRPLYHVA